MTLKESWYKSAQMVRPHNLIIFFRQCWGAIAETYTLLYTHFWWLPVIGLSALYIERFFEPSPITDIFTLVIGSFPIFLCARSVLEPKDYDYFFRKYKKHLGGVLLGCILFMPFYALVMTLLQTVGFGPEHFYQYSRLTADVTPINNDMLQALGSIFKIIISPFFSFDFFSVYFMLFVFIYLDSDGALQYVWHAAVTAFEIVVYTYPFTLLVAWINSGFEVAFMLMISLELREATALLFFLPVEISLAAVTYYSYIRRHLFVD